MASSHVVASHTTQILSSFRQILQFRFRENRQGRIPPWKVTKTRPFLSTCYGYPSTTEVPPCCQAATKKLTFSTTSVLLLLNVPLPLSRGTVFRRPVMNRKVNTILCPVLQLVNSMDRKPRAQSPSIGISMQRALPIDHEYNVLFHLYRRCCGERFVAHTFI